MKSSIRILVLITIMLLISGSTWSETKTPQNKLVVYYFHRTARCPSCLHLEELTKQAVSIGFEGDLKTGRVELAVINIDEPPHAHFEKDYALEFQSVVLSSVDNGKETSWKNLPEIWDYLEDDEKFISYIHNEIKAFLKHH